MTCMIDYFFYCIWRQPRPRAVGLGVGLGLEHMASFLTSLLPSQLQSTVTLGQYQFIVFGEQRHVCVSERFAA